MSRLLAPDDNCRGIEVRKARNGGTVAYERQRDGTLHVESKAHERALRDTGCTSASVGGIIHSPGRTCRSCGFVALFTTCGRCGAPTERTV